MSLFKPHLFKFRTVWHLHAPLSVVWNHIEHAIQYPTWWPSVKKVILLKKSPSSLMSSMDASYVVQSPFYTLRYQTEVVAFEKDNYILARVSGDLAGHGRWTFVASANGTEARLDWEVKVTPIFLQFFSHLPGVKSVMRYFHNRLMKQGETGLQALLKRQLNTDK